MLRPRPRDRQDLGDHAANVAIDHLDFEFIGFDLAEVEKVADQLEQGLRRDARHPRQLGLLAVELGRGQELQIADDAVERRADLVAHIGEESGLRDAGLFGQLRQGAHQIDAHADAGINAVLGDDEGRFQRIGPLGRRQQADLLDRLLMIDD